MPTIQEREPPARPESSLQLCAFSVGEERYVIDIMRIHEIVQPTKITAVPGSPDFVEGVVTLHESVVPVLDLRRRLGLPPAPKSRRTKLVICRVGKRLFALLVDAVLGVQRVTRSQIKRAPEVLGTGPNRYFLGMVGNRDDIRLLLNVKALVGSPAPVPAASERAEAKRQG
jgi:purine-binding chemotaxis protein CheW